jgi:FkbM family methyltransferase
LASPREPRERFLQLAQEFVPYLVAERDGLLFVLPTDDPTLAKLFVRLQRHKERAVLKRTLRRLNEAGIQVPRSTLLDIGASVGTMAFAALQAGFSSVVACEPLPSSFRLLRANLVLNGFEDRVRAVEVALSNRAGTATLDVERGSRQARLLARPGESPGGRSHEVRLARLDDLAAEGIFDSSEVGLLVMDAEGHECQVLEGAENVLQANVPIVMELNPKLLRLAGRFGDLAGLLARHYTHVLDLRDRSEPPFEPVDHVESLIDSFEAAGRSTDILAVRLPASS